MFVLLFSFFPSHFLFSSVSVSNRLMMIICAHPPVCAVHALIGACLLVSSIRTAEKVWGGGV